ncbi:MAG TPA: carboxymuconolactone decarboxylase family protein [Solirubrobacteraceae bacterium]|nr:carboxymuconolactone decarboxylase family protein [Solirubrobacteraceae bacterium]
MSAAGDSVSGQSRTDDLLFEISRIAPEVAAGYEQIREVIAEDGALSAGWKALLVSVCATARGYGEMARAELERGRAAGIGDREVGVAAVALLLARGEELTGRFVDIAGGLSGSGSARPASDLDAEAYFLSYLGVSSLPARMAIMSERVPEVFAGYHRMHHGALAADPGATKLGELVLVALNAAELQREFVRIHAATARKASATDDELVEAIVCAIRVVGVAAWAAGAEGLFPDG